MKRRPHAANQENSKVSGCEPQQPSQLAARGRPPSTVLNLVMTPRLISRQLEVTIGCGWYARLVPMHPLE